MADGRLFHYRFNPADCYAEIDEMSIEERGRFLTKICRDLVKGESDNCFISGMIEEARKYIETKKLAGKKGGEAKSSSAKAVLSSAIAEPSTPLASSSSSSSTEAVTEQKQKKESKSSRFTPPTIEEVKDYFSERKAFDESEEFFHYHESKGWKVGNAKMANWKAAVVTWIRNDFKGQQKAHFDRNKPEGELARAVRLEKEAMAARRDKLNQGAYQ